jgi:hypothetical protein
VRFSASLVSRRSPAGRNSRSRAGAPRLLASARSRDTRLSPPPPPAPERRRWVGSFCRRCRLWAPQMMEKFQAELHRVSAYLRWPARWRHRLRTTNLAESFFRHRRRYLSRFPAAPMRHIASTSSVASSWLVSRLMLEDLIVTRSTPKPAFNRNARECPSGRWCPNFASVTRLAGAVILRSRRRRRICC